MDTLWPTEVGYLRRGDRGAVFTALASLHRSRLITVGRNGLRRTNRSLPAGGDPLRQTVYDALHPQPTVRSLAGTSSVRRALYELAEHLAELGLVPRRPVKFAVRFVLLLIPITALVGLTTGRLGPLGFGAALVVFAVCWRLSRRTLAGHVAMLRMRREHNKMLAGFARRGLTGVRMSDRGLYSPTDYSSYGLGTDSSTP